MVTYLDVISKIDKLEKFKNEMISALKYVGVYCDSSTSIHDLPDLIMQIGTGSKGFPVSMSRIGYDSFDTRCANYRYVCHRIYDFRDGTEWEVLNMDTLVSDINSEISKSASKGYPRRNDYFRDWDGCFPAYGNTSNLTSFEYMFYNAPNIVYIPPYDTRNVTSFYNVGFNKIIHEIPEFDCIKAEDMQLVLEGSQYYIFGLKNIGADSSVQITQCWRMLCGIGFDVKDTTGPWAPCRGAIIRHSMRLYKVQPGVGNDGSPTATIGANILGCEGFFELDKSLDLSYSKYISRNSLENIVNSVRDVAALRDTDEELGWTPELILPRSVASDSTRWDNTDLPRRLRAKGWKIVEV